MKRTLLATAALSAMLVAAPVLSQPEVSCDACSGEVREATALVSQGRYADAQTALFWAADADDVDAQLFLGMIYFYGSATEGQEVKVDPYAAAYWFARAANFGNQVAEFMLSTLDAEGVSLDSITEVASGQP